VRHPRIRSACHGSPKERLDKRLFDGLLKAGFIYRSRKGAQAMDLWELLARWEANEIKISEELYKQYSGQPPDEGRMAEAAAAIETLARAGVKDHRKDVAPNLFHAMIAATVSKERTRLENEIYRKRNDEVFVEAAGERVNLNNVRLFNYKHVGDGLLRKQVFDDLLERAAILTPVLEQRFDLHRRAYGEYGTNPLDVYLEEEHVDLATLKRVVRESSDRAKPVFLQDAETISPEVIGKKMEYYDDMYVFRHVIYRPIDAKFAAMNFVDQLRGVARNLGFAVDTIQIDAEPRAGKYSSPICFGIQIPGDVRVLFQRTSPFGDYTGFWHEMGHALHFASVEAERSFAERRLIPNGVAEIFSTLFEELSSNPLFLSEDLNLDPATIREIARRTRFMNLFFLTFYGANSLFKIQFWEDGLTMDEADEAYEDLTEKCTGIRIPGRYWQTHHVVSMNDMYAPSYLLAHIRKSELILALERRFGKSWWRDPSAGEWLRDEAMGPGGAIDLASFSKLDPEPYLASVFRDGTG
jgi:hypothetical protein